MSNTPKEGVPTLVQVRRNFTTEHYNKYILCTISPPQNCLVEAKNVTQGKNIKIRYGNMKQALQKDFINRLIEVVYKPYIDSYIGVYELNKQGNVHAHIIIHDKEIQTDYDLQCFRRTTNTNPRLLKYVRNMKDIVHFNHIVFIDDIVDTVDYLNKDLKQSYKHFGIIDSKTDEDNYLPVLDFI